MKLNELTISEAAEGLRQKTFSVKELVSDCLKAVKERDGKINSYLEVFSEEALEEAEKADETIRNTGGKNLPPLFGIPLAVKDNILIEGKKCTAGSRILENYVASYDAAAAVKLKNQGAVILGKTNMDEFAMGSSTENSAFKKTRNPADLERVPGGSSGGSAAAVAAALCLGALGSDTGGSIRQPASFCGVVGFKPTYGAVSRHGLMAMASSLDQIGPFAKSAEDAAVILKAIAGEDAFDATAAGAGSLAPENKKTGLKGVKIGVPKEYFGGGLDAEIEKTIAGALEKLKNAGAEIKEISLPYSQYALACYYLIVPSEVSANLARFDGIRYGASAEKIVNLGAKNLYEIYAKTRAYGFGNEVKRRIMLGTYALSAGYYDAYYLKAQKVRRLIKEDFERAFKEVDFIAGPTTPTPAFKFGEKTDNPLEMYLADIYTVAVNLAGIPAVSVPAGAVSKEGKNLPAGMQFIGARFSDYELLSAASFAEAAFK